MHYGYDLYVGVILLGLSIHNTNSRRPHATNQN